MPPPAAPPLPSAAFPQSAAARASGPESGARPAARNAATIEPAEVPTKYSQSRKSMPVARPAPSSSPRIQASPSVPPAASTRTSGRRVSGSAIAISLRTPRVTTTRGAGVEVTLVGPAGSADADLAHAIAALAGEVDAAPGGERPPPQRAAAALGEPR